MKSRSWLSAVVCVQALCAVAQARAQQTPGPEIRSVVFDGNETFPEDSLARALVTRETSCRSFFLIPLCWVDAGLALRRSYLRERELVLDRTRLAIWYQRHGFPEAQVDTATVAAIAGGVEVTFSLVEGPPILVRTVGLQGGVEALGPGLFADLMLRPGDPLSERAVEATRDTLRQRLRERGYAHADVFFQTIRPASSPYEAQVTIDVRPGPPTVYGEIEIQGTHHVSEATILRTLQFEPGDPFRESDLEAARARLFGLDIVRSARIDIETPTDTTTVLPVSVVVQEADPYWVRTGVGWSQDQCFAVEGRWASRNFLGGGRVLEVRGRVANVLAHRLNDAMCAASGTGDYADLTWVGAVEVTQPWIFSSRNSLAATVFVERETLPPDIFLREATGFRIALARVVARGTVLSLSWLPERSELDADDVLFCASFLVCDPEDIDLLEERNRLAPIGLSLTRDVSDNLLDPSSGSRLSVELEHAAGWTGSDFSYDRVLADLARYHGVEQYVLATRLRVGWVGSGPFQKPAAPESDIRIVHPQRRFYAGGATSVRGYAQSRLGPSVLVAESPVGLLSARDEGGAGCTPDELIALTCDAGAGAETVTLLEERPTGGTRVVEGNAEVRFPLGDGLEGVFFTDFGQVWDVDETVDLRELVFTPGIGVRIASPVGPIRLDLAYRWQGVESLPVITSQIRPFDPGVDAAEDRLVVDGAPIPYVATEELVQLRPPVAWDGGGSGLQLHLSIGQAF